jgi:general secretion pathway protein D
VILAGTSLAPVCAESPESEFKAGERAEKKNDLDSAFQAYKKAYLAKPNDPKYTAAFLKTRLYASSTHIRAGQALDDQGKLQESMTEFRLAAQIDPTNFEALGQIRRVADQIQRQIREKEVAALPKATTTALEADAKNAAGPVALDLKSDVPVSIHMTANADVIYKSIAKLAGFNVLFDPDYKPQKVTFELKDVSLRDALSMIAMQSKTFWRPLSSNTIMVSSDSGARRKDLEQSVMKTFYLKNAATPADLQQAAGTLKGILDISHIQVTPELRSLTLRGTPDQMVMAQKLLGDIDKPKSEVMIDVVVMEVSRGRLQTLGTVPPTTVSVALAPGGVSGSSGSSGSGLALNSFSGITAGDISVSVGGASFTALASDSNSKVLQRPQIRAMDSEKASLKIGDRIPIATGSYQSGITSGVNTQFQYIDVGVNIDITPYVHGDNDVTLKMSLEVSSVTGEQTVDGVTEPTIGQRRIEHEARLADGEVNLIGGILEDTESKSMSGYPLLMKIPILKYLFGQEARDREQTEIVFAIIPHILRSTEVTDENLKMVDLGSASSITYRKAELKNDPAPTAPTAPAQPAAEKPATAPAAPVTKSSVKSATTPQAFSPAIKLLESSPFMSPAAPALAAAVAAAQAPSPSSGAGSPSGLATMPRPPVIAAAPTASSPPPTTGTSATGPAAAMQSLASSPLLSPTTPELKSLIAAAL